MSEELEIKKDQTVAEADEPYYSTLFGGELDQDRRLADHKVWLNSIRHERPNPAKHFKVGIYIRYFNQTSYEDYLDRHIERYNDTLALCPNWELMDYYIDRGATAPLMTNAPDWCRLLQDCMDEKVNLIITQKVSNVSSDPKEITFVARLFASLKKPVGMYFISEDIYTLASYYKASLRDEGFFPPGDWTPLPDDDDDEPVAALSAGGGVQ